MTTSPSPEHLEEILRPVVSDAGLFLEEVTITGAAKNPVVRVILDLPVDQTGAITMDQVAAGSRLVSDALDTVTFLASAYTLEVSSPGTSRPLTAERHFARNIGRLIKVVTTDGEKFTARLTGISGGVLEFENDQTIEIAQVRKAQVEVELKRLEALKDEDFGDEAQFASGLEDDEA